MSRKMIDACTDFFESIKNVHGIFDSKIRYIKTNDEEKNWLQKSIFKDSYSISTSKNFSLIEYEKNNYLIVCGFEKYDICPLGFDESDLNAGLFVTIITEKKIVIKEEFDKYEVEENILAQNKDDMGLSYVGHDFKELLKYFPNIFVFKINDDFIGENDNLLQIISVFLVSNPKFLLLPYSNLTLNKILELVSTNSKILRYDNIVSALNSSSFKFAFLDLYRCIEMLYQIIYIDEVHLSLSLNLKKKDFLDEIEKKLNWKPIEANSLLKILEETKDADKESLYRTIEKINTSTIFINTEPYSKWIYKLRNSIVHLSTNHNTINLNNSEWDSLIFGIINILCFWYNKFPDFK